MNRCNMRWQMWEDMLGFKVWFCSFFLIDLFFYCIDPAGQPQYCTHAVHLKPHHMGKPFHIVVSLKPNTYHECWISMLGSEHNAALSSVKSLILTHTLSSFCLFWADFLVRCPSSSAKVAMVITDIFLKFFLYRHWMLPRLLFCLLFVTGWCSSAGDAVAVWPQSVAVALL